MIQHVTAIYEQGLLRPLAALDLNEQEVVELSIGRQAENGQTGGPTLYEVFAEAGLIGCMKDASADLSTNPQHLEGFGQSGD